MPRATLALILALVSLAGCKRKELEAALAEAQRKLTHTEQRLAQEQDTNQSMETSKKRLEDRIAELESDLQQLEAQIEDLAQKQGLTANELAELRNEKAKREKELKVYRDLFERLRQLVDAGTIQIVLRKGQMVVKLSSAILFDSGKTELRPQGEDALRQLVPALQSAEGRAFLVAGHTDNVPIKTARFRSNWELSTARAVEVVKFMVAQGYPADRLGAAGYGEHDPVSKNDTEEERAQNRRIEILLVPNLEEIPQLREMIEGKT